MKNAKIPAEEFDRLLAMIEPALKQGASPSDLTAADCAFKSLRSYAPTKIEGKRQQGIKAVLSLVKHGPNADDTCELSVYSHGRWIITIPNVHAKVTVVNALNAIHDLRYTTHVVKGGTTEMYFQGIQRSEWEKALDLAHDNQENILFCGETVLWDDWKAFFADKPGLHSDDETERARRLV